MLGDVASRCFAAEGRGAAGEEAAAEDDAATGDGDEAVPLAAEERLPEEQGLHQKGQAAIILQ